MISTDLYARASSLDALADDVEVCVDVARAVTDTPDWECSNATDVREALAQWQSTARTSADNLRDEAARVRGEARRAAEREADARDEARRRVR